MGKSSIKDSLMMIVMAKNNKEPELMTKTMAKTLAKACLGSQARQQRGNARRQLRGGSKLPTLVDPGN